MNENKRSADWQVFGAIALIALGAFLLMNQIGGPWWGMVREAFRAAASYAWPLALIGLGAILLINARHGTFATGADGRRLYRSRSERMVGGVLGGLAEYLGGVDPVWLRIAYVLVAVATGFGPAVIVYIIAMIVIPEAPRPAHEPTQWPQPCEPPAPPAPPGTQPPHAPTVE